MRDSIDVFPENDDDLGCISGLALTQEMRIYPTALACRQETEDVLCQLAVQGKIEQSSCPWSAAFVLAKKKNGPIQVLCQL